MGRDENGEKDLGDVDIGMGVEMMHQGNYYAHVGEYRWFCCVRATAFAVAAVVGSTAGIMMRRSSPVIRSAVCCFQFTGASVRR